MCGWFGRYALGCWRCRGCKRRETPAAFRVTAFKVTVFRVSE
jgi:hypothetical protein